MHEPNYPQLREDVEQLVGAAQSIRATGILCELESGWTVMQAVFTVLHDGCERPRPLSIEEAGIWAFEQELSRADLNETMLKLQAGELTLPRSFRSAKLSCDAYPGRPRFMERWQARRDLAVDWPCDTLHVQAGGFANAKGLDDRWQAFVESLMTKEPAFHSLGTLKEELHLFRDTGPQRASQLEVWAPRRARIADASVTIEQQALSVLIEAHGDARETFRVSVSPSENPRDGRVFGAAEFCEVTEQPGTFQKTLPLSCPGPVVVGLSGVRKQREDEAETGFPHVPALIHHCLDLNFQMLRALLSGAGGQNSGREFERGVAWLLHVGGYSAMHSGMKDGKKEMPDSADIVAISPEGDIIVGECAVGDADATKVGKLLRRSSSLERSLTSANVPCRVIPVVFLSVDPGEAYEGVVAIGRRELDDLVDRSLRGVRWRIASRK